MFDKILASLASARTSGDGVRACARLENAACAARLSHMADMLAAAYSASGSAEREQWRVDNWGAVCARIGAAHAVTSGVVSGLLMDAVTLRERLPQVGEVFAEGLISYRMVHLICTRTMLVKDAGTLRRLDGEAAEMLRRWGAKTVTEVQRDIDALVLRHDPHAVRRNESSSRGNHVDVDTDPGDGVAYVTARVSTTDGEAFDSRADALARTVCDRDPRDRDQRRAAALGAMGFGWDRLPCLCETDGCDAAGRPGAGGVVVHVIVGPETEESESDCIPTESADEHSRGELTTQRRALVGARTPLLPKPWYRYTLRGLIAALAPGSGQFCAVRPGLILGGGVLPAPVAAQAALHAVVRRLVHPGDATPEPRYRPSRALADFVRCRDQTCRFPGCAKPATHADIDHTIPYPYGPTCASNLVCLCREHHLLKTFWPGWSTQQFTDGTLVWTDPDGDTYTTHPGSRLLFPELCAPTAPVTGARTPPPKHTAGLMMPKRAITRAEARRRRVDDERRANADENPESSTGG
ncbi:DUF222 domain-containing protein [Mycobacterium sp. ITM-2016-00317]|uniref:HNH endonuclease signature motif containing protein n=1 Tax=Mycobacterium sp. ITM-2016-00317 TaxID=2099694 RepID=UPI00287F9440|nr:DUF222 domain-containing protein [Mycobacterium sp. ITM-2016-00317]WNG88160.1 DUF222 domain-containing protein [Mycobacterium sp. ITM-2016-00317]